MRLLIFLYIITHSLIHSNPLPEFEPQKPAKPLRFCSLQKDYLAAVAKFPDWEEIRISNVVVQMPYASFDNFCGHDLYCGIQRAFLHKDAAKKLKLAAAILKKQYPNYKFILFDAARPYHAQEMLRAAVRGTPWSHFVSAPSTGSIHSFGMAVDIGILDESGKPLDMGLPYDSFAFHAGKQGEKEALAQGLLSQTHINNREILRSVMRDAGWTSLQTEWWHFNAAPGDSIRANYQIPEYIKQSE